MVLMKKLYDGKLVLGVGERRECCAEVSSKGFFVDISRRIR